MKVNDIIITNYRTCNETGLCLVDVVTDELEVKFLSILSKKQRRLRRKLTCFCRPDEPSWPRHQLPKYNRIIISVRLSFEQKTILQIIFLSMSNYFELLQTGVILNYYIDWSEPSSGKCFVMLGIRDRKKKLKIQYIE